jgi:glycosyltransferase involved in cell wall biosynthesis
MRILYISDRGKGGIKNHVKCLLACLKGVDGVVTYCIGEDEPFAGRNGHDFAEWKQIRRTIKTFKPDVIHLHTLPLLMCLYMKLFVRVPLFVSLHTPWDRKLPLKDRILHWLVKSAYYLPVSSVTWDSFRKWFKGVKGEVFFNPIIINDTMRHRNIKKGIKGDVPVIGAVGRNADQKDWPSFHRVVDKVCAIRPEVDVWNLGEEGFCKNANERIKDMDIFVMTSKHEELPTTMLECFVSKTAICGFIPRGGMSDILSF